MSPRRVDAPALVFGVLFTSIAAWWLADHNFALDLPNPGWLLALLLIVGGTLGISGAIRNSADRGRSRDGDPDDPTWHS